MKIYVCSERSPETRDPLGKYRVLKIHFSLEEVLIAPIGEVDSIYIYSGEIDSSLPFDYWIESEKIRDLVYLGKCSPSFEGLTFQEKLDRFEPVENVRMNKLDLILED